MKKVILDTGGVMIYKLEEVKWMITIKNGMGDVTILSDSLLPIFSLFVIISGNPFLPPRPLCDIISKSPLVDLSLNLRSNNLFV